MRLKSFLNFRGNSILNEITFHTVGTTNKDSTIEVDNYKKWWEYLSLLNRNHSMDDIAEWSKKYNITEKEIDEANRFLINEIKIVFSNNVQLPPIYQRTTNFYNSFLISGHEDEILNNFAKKQF